MQLSYCSAGFHRCTVTSTSCLGRHYFCPVWMACVMCVKFTKWSSETNKSFKLDRVIHISNYTDELRTDIWLQGNQLSFTLVSVLICKFTQTQWILKFLCTKIDFHECHISCVSAPVKDLLIHSCISSSINETHYMNQCHMATVSLSELLLWAVAVYEFPPAYNTKWHPDTLIINQTSAWITHIVFLFTAIIN